MRDAFVARLSELAERDPDVVLITGDLGFGVLTEFAKRFPRQFVNAGVAEQNMIGIASGMAREGFKVFTYSIANFAFMRGLEQIRNDASYHDGNVNVVAVGGGFSYGALGISHHATEDLAIMRSLPGLTVLSPCDDWEAAESAEAVAALPGTSYIRLDKTPASTTRVADEEFVVGEARCVRQGDDLTLVGTGGAVGECLAAADQLAERGVSCRVLSLHTITPLDFNALRRAATETGGVITVEEHTVNGGLGGAIAEALLESGTVPGFFHRVGLRDGFSSVVGSQSYLRRQYELDAVAITRAALSRLGREAIGDAAAVQLVA